MCVSVVLSAGCERGRAPASTAAAPATTSSSSGARAQTQTSEPRLEDLRQLTAGGENAEAYWSFDGKQLIFQAHEGEGCDQIYRMPLGQPPLRVSTGKGATTCSYFLPGDKQLVYASTHLGGDACPPKPDKSQGYVWALYRDYDIFKANADGSGLTRLTTTDGYDAEATVCKKDGSIVFTSVRDGDIELYRMNADGTDVRRLTRAAGYDGGAFFNDDCSKLVWRASRPRGAALDDYKALLAKGLVRPSKLELYVANADGSNATQVTYLNAASFAPFWVPGRERLIFSSNYGDPRGREFELWAVNANGTNLERVTNSPGFDGFPMFSPDGKTLAFASNRATAPGRHDTNLFLAKWNDAPLAAGAESGADRVQSDIAWLSDPAREGRGLGTKGLLAAAEYIEQRMAQLGLQPAGENGTYRDHFEVASRVLIGKETSLELAGKDVDSASFQPLSFSAQAKVEAELLAAGFGIVAKQLKHDDYEGRSAKGKIVVVRRFVPESDKFALPADQRRYGDLWYKAVTARAAGAVGMLVVDAPLRPARAGADWKMPDEAKFPDLSRENYGDAGIPVAIVKRASFESVLRDLEQRRKVKAVLNVALGYEKQPAFNVVGRIVANSPAAERVPGELVIGAHYDHLGYGGAHSLAPDVHTPHVGADDNASGVAGMLEIARILRNAPKLRQDVLVIGFSAEESGVLGSSHLIHEPPPGLDVKRFRAMLNLDMVGRLRDNRLTVLGVKTAAEWQGLLGAACDRQRIECDGGGDGYGPSDQTSFYAAGIPVLHFFSGSHVDYHKPSDTADRINAAGAAQVAQLVADVAQAVTELPQPLGYRHVAPEAPRGDLRSFNASLGTIPDYAGPPEGGGVLLAGVRPGSAAERAGLSRGDILIGLGKTELKSLHDFMFVLNASKPGQTLTARVKRDGKIVELPVTFDERSPRKE